MVFRGRSLSGKSCHEPRLRRLGLRRRGGAGVGGEDVGAPSSLRHLLGAVAGPPKAGG